jgi:hypothetical protein
MRHIIDFFSLCAAVLAVVFGFIIILLISFVGVTLFSILWILSPIYYIVSSPWRRKRDGNDKAAQAASID